MKTQITALLVVAVLMVAIVPGVLAKQPAVTGRKNPQMTAGEDEPVPVPISAVAQPSNIKERVRELVREKQAAVAQRIQNLTQIGRKAITTAARPQAEDVRSYMQEKFQIAINRCKELNLAPERCEQTLENRAQLVERLSEQALERVRKIEARKLEVANRLVELREEKNFRHLNLVNNTIKGREIARQKIETARTRFENARNRYNAVKGNLTDVRDEFVQTRQQLRACPDNETACEQLRYRIKEHTRDYLANFLEMALQQLEKVRAQVESAEDLSEEDAAALLARIDEKITEVQDLMDSVGNVTSETTKEEVQAIVDEVKDIWQQEVKAALQRAAGFLQANKMGGVYVKMLHLEKKLENALAKMAERGIDTSSAQSAIEAFNAKIEEAKVHYEQAVETFKEAATLRGQQRAAAIQEANGHMRLAKQTLKEAHQALMNAVKSLRGIGVTDEDLEEDESDDVLDVQDEEIAEEEPEEPEEPENVTEPVTPPANETAPQNQTV